MTKGQLALKLHIKIRELEDPILKELERADKVKLAEMKSNLAVELRRDQG
jgi:hypothetical protein